jgi:hypothetical protein
MSFRQRLDAVLRTREARQVQEFLIAERQWSEDVPTDPELAMWLMIAGSSSLQDLREQARAWLVSHGHQEEAEAILGKRKKSSPVSKNTPTTRPPQRVKRSPQVNSPPSSKNPQLQRNRTKKAGD